PRLDARDMAVSSQAIPGRFNRASRSRSICGTASNEKTLALPKTWGKSTGQRRVRAAARVFILCGRVSFRGDAARSAVRGARGPVQRVPAEARGARLARGGG